MTARRRRRLQRSRLLRYCIGVGLIAAVLYRVDWSATARELSRLSAPLVLAAFAAMAIGLVVSAWKWDWALRLHGLYLPFGFLLRKLCVGFFFNSFLPSAIGGDAYRILSTIPRDGFRSRALSAVVIERSMGFLALMVLGAAGALRITDQRFAREYTVILAATALLGIATFVAIKAGWLQQLTSRLRYPAFNSLRHNLTLLRRRRVEWLGLIAGSCAFQIVSIGAIFLLFLAINGHTTFAQCALIAAIVGIAAALPISINGIGVMEGAMVAAAVALHLNYDQAVIVALSRRALALILASLSGLLWLAERHTPRPSGRPEGFRELATILRHRGPRGLLDAMQSPSPQSPISAPCDSPRAPDVPLAEPPLATQPSQWPTHLLEYTHDAIIIWEMQGAGILYWNRAAEQLYGYDRTEACGRVTHELLKTELTGGVQKLEAHLSRSAIWVGELRHATRAGRCVVVESRLMLMPQRNGRWLVLEVNRDITDRKVADTERNALKARLDELRGCWHIP